MLGTKSLSRSKILDAAMKIIGERGFLGMTMRSLAKQVGILPGSIYHHFSSKQELLSEVLFRLQCQRLDRAHSASRGKNPALALVCMIEALWKDTRMEIGHLTLRSEARYLQAKELETYGLREELFVHAFQQVVVKGVKNGSFCVDDASAIARSLIALVEHSALRPGASMHGTVSMVEKLVGSLGLPGSDTKHPTPEI